jgi:hypothetical protein
MPIISKTKLSTNEYSPVLSFLIDCNAGDNTVWQYIESLSDFYKKFNTFEYSPSYEYASNLLSIGYKIVVKNKNTNTNYKNIRIFNNSKFTHVNIDKDYTSNIAINQQLDTTDLLSFDITINSPLSDQNYLLINNGYYNILFWWNLTNQETPPLPTEYYFKLIKMTTLSLSDFTNELRGLGYKIEQIDDKRLRIYNFSDLSIVKNSSSNIVIDYTNKNGSYDALAYYYDTVKLVDIISKIPSNNDDIKVKIIFDGLKFSISIYKSTLNIVVYNEYFSDSSMSKLLDKVNMNSSLVKVIVYTDNLTELTTNIQGEFSLKREIEGASVFKPEYEELLDKYFIDIYIDLFTENLPDGNYLFFSKNRNSQNKTLVIFEDNDICLKDNNKLHITFGFLYSFITNYSFLGNIDFKFSLETYTNDNANNDTINKIQFDNFNYYIDKCRIKNQEVSVIIVPYLLSNYIQREISNNISESDLTFLLNNFQSYMNEDIVKSITLTTYDDSVFNNLSINIELQLTYESIDLIEDIKLDLLY